MYCIFSQVVDTSQSIADIPEWFKGSRLNYAENLLKHKDNDKIALYAASKKEISGSSLFIVPRNSLCGTPLLCMKL